MKFAISKSAGGKDSMKRSDDGEDLLPAASEHGENENDIQVNDKKAMVARTEHAIEYVDALQNDLTHRHGMERRNCFENFVEYVLAIIRSLLWMLTLGWIPGAASLELTELDQCAAPSEETEEVNAPWLGWFEVVMLTLWTTTGVVGFVMGKATGWRGGREHRLNMRHLGYQKRRQQSALNWSSRWRT